MIRSVQQNFRKGNTRKFDAKAKSIPIERGRTWDFGTKDRPFPGFEPKVVPEVSGIDDALKSDFEIISGTSKKGKEISEKLGITAKPGVSRYGKW